jgi:MFS family permease
MRSKILSIAFLLLATTAGMSLWFMTAAILPDIARDRGVSDTDLAALSSAVQAGFVFGAVTIALSGIADRADPRRVFATCAIGTGLANLALLAVPIDGVLAVGLRFVTGALMAGVYPIGMKIAVGWGLRDRGFLVGLVVGAIATGKSLPYLLAWLGGADWRLVLMLGSVLAAAGGGLVLLAGLGPHHVRAANFRPSAVLLAWTDRRIRSAYFGYFGHMWELFVLWAWLSTAAAVSYGASLAPATAESLAKLTAFVAILVGAPISIFAGRLADRFGKARIAALALAASGSAALVTAATFGGPPWLTFALFVLWGVAVVPDSAQFSALVADFAPGELAGSLLTLQTALGFTLTVVTLQGAPLVAGALGWPALLALLAVGPAFGIWGLRPLLRAGQ